jgi:hypothetical protein
LGLGQSAGFSHRVEGDLGRERGKIYRMADVEARDEVCLA